MINHTESRHVLSVTQWVKYHPHGDSSIYETLVVLSQDFKKGMALVDGHGNFGSIRRGRCRHKYDIWKPS